MTEFPDIRLYVKFNLRVWPSSANIYKIATLFPHPVPLMLFFCLFLLYIS